MVYEPSFMKRVGLDDMMHHKYFFDSVLDGKFIMERPMTPSKWNKEEYDVKPVTILNMRQWWGASTGVDDLKQILIERVDLTEIRDKRGVAIFKDWKGEDIVVNLGYLVTARNGYSVMTVELNSDNPNYEKGVYYYHMLMKDGTKIELKN